MFTLGATLALGENTKDFEWFESTNDLEWLNEYEGDINQTYGIGMTLIFNGKKISGSYYYTKYLKDIKLTGTLLDETRIELNEHDTNGDVTAIFRCNFIKKATQNPRDHHNDGILNRTVITGMWQKTGRGHTSLPFKLSNNYAIARNKGQGGYAVAGVEDDAKFEKSVRDCLKAVQDNNKLKVLRCINYPVGVYLNKDDADLGQLDRKDLADLYEKIFTNDYKKRLSTLVPHNMFAKYSGIMLRNGEVWLGPNSKVISINTKWPD